MSALALPAFIALFVKVILFAYALRAPRRDPNTRLFLALLVLFTLHNVVEFVGFNHLALHGMDETMEVVGLLYFVVGIPFFAVLLHLSLRISTDSWEQMRRVVPWLYLPIPILEYLLLGTDKLVTGFTIFKDYTILRVPGSLYFLFETYAPLYLLAAVTYLIYGARSSRPSRVNRIRNRYWLAALVPLVALHTYLIAANHFGLAKLSASLYGPIAVTIFLVVTTYATHQYRLFDIEFFLPWSKVRKRKTEFYKRIQATIAEIAELRSVRRVLDLIASTLHCQVALIGGPRPLVALAPGQERGTSGLALPGFPREALVKLENIVVANEIAESLPELHGLMKRHKVGAIVPFNSHSATAGHWMLLGEHFSDNVYSPLDFKQVEALFDKIGERFLDDLLLLRSQLTDAKEEIHHYQRRLAIAWDELATVRRKLTRLETENRRLREENAQMRREQLRLITSEVPQAIIKGEQTLEQYLAEFEEALVSAALKECGGDKIKAARLLGVTPDTLSYLMTRHHLDLDQRIE